MIRILRSHLFRAGVLSAALLGGSAHAMAAAMPAPGATHDVGATLAQQDDEPSRVLATAVTIFNAVPLSECPTPRPETQSCVDLRSTPEAISHGIALVGVSGPQDGGFIAILGRRADGSWGYWFGTQNTTSDLLQLPGPVMVCDWDRGGTLLDGEGVAWLPERTQLNADQFVLIHAGYPHAGSRGSGWYHVTTSDGVQGWMAADELTAASNGDCLVHDIQVKPNPLP